jgi:hypothetical protein
MLMVGFWAIVEHLLIHFFIHLYRFGALIFCMGMGRAETAFGFGNKHSNGYIPPEPGCQRNYQMSA